MDRALTLVKKCEDRAGQGRRPRGGSGGAPGVWDTGG